MSIDSQEDLLGIKAAGKVVAMAREEMAKAIKPGVTTYELDMIGQKVLSAYGARSAPKTDYSFPGTTCISVNDVAAHGIPGQYRIAEGDMVNIDISAELNGYYADTGVTIPVGEVAGIKKELIECSKNALEQAICKAKAGTKINQIGRRIYNAARACNFTVIKNLAGHGIGKRLHEAPEEILNYYNPWDHRLLTNGLVLAVETFISSKAEYVVEDRDGWTLRTPDKSFVAQFEHTIIITKDEPIVVTVM